MYARRVTQGTGVGTQIQYGVYTFGEIMRECYLPVLLSLNGSSAGSLSLCAVIARLTIRFAHVDVGIVGMDSSATAIVEFEL